MRVWCAPEAVARPVSDHAPGRPETPVGVPKRDKVGQGVLHSGRALLISLLASTRNRLLCEGKVGKYLM